MRDIQTTRRRWLGSLAALAVAPATGWAQVRRHGRLVIIGGAEDRVNDRIILNKFLHLSGGAQARILVLTAASTDQAGAWAAYEAVFRELGARNVAPLIIESAEQANTPEVANEILGADGIFMSGGDQSRLMERLWDTGAARAMHTAFHLRGCCIGGTSAGAAVMSRHMLAGGTAPKLPEKNVASLDVGLGFVSNAIIDQHFSERRRTGRLLSVLAQVPQMLGVGIDEDTALVIERGRGVEIFGQGAVTLIDGRRMHSNVDDLEANERLEMLDVRLHVLPAGHRYDVEPRSRYLQETTPASLRDAIKALVEPGPLRG
jgi:cyanophycinase